MLFSPPAYEAHESLLARLAAEKRRRDAVRVGEEQAAADAAMRSLELVKASGSTVPLPAPTPDKIARHVKRFGSDGVNDVLVAYGVADGKLTAPQLREQGYSVEEISKTLKISVSKVRLALSA